MQSPGSLSIPGASNMMSRNMVPIFILEFHCYMLLWMTIATMEGGPVGKLSKNPDRKRIRADIHDLSMAYLSWLQATVLVVLMHELFRFRLPPVPRVVRAIPPLDRAESTEDPGRKHYKRIAEERE